MANVPLEVGMRVFNMWPDYTFSHGVITEDMQDGRYRVKWYDREGADPWSTKLVSFWRRAFTDREYIAMLEASKAIPKVCVCCKSGIAEYCEDCANER